MKLRVVSAGSTTYFLKVSFLQLKMLAAELSSYIPFLSVKTWKDQLLFSDVRIFVLIIQLIEKK